MSRTTSNKRPWLAALLSAFVTGLGHLYLRRWRRAIGWLLAIVGVGSLFVEPAALESLLSGRQPDFLAVAPIFIVGSLCVGDTYLIALTQNAATRVTTDSDGHRTDCPNCGKELEPDLEFCHWCTTEIERFDDAPPAVSGERDDF